MGLMAAPVTEDAVDVVARESDGVSPNHHASGLSSRHNGIMCQTVGASVVNCRAGPGTNYKVVTTVKKGEWGIFTCVKSGQCVTVAGVPTGECCRVSTPFAAADQARLSQRVGLHPICWHQRLLHQRALHRRFLHSRHVTFFRSRDFRRRRSLTQPQRHSDGVRSCELASGAQYQL